MGDAATDAALPPRRIIVAGDARDTFDALVARVATVHGNPNAGPFDGVLVAGRIFPGTEAAQAMQPYIDGAKTVPVPMYFVDADGAEGLEYALSRAAATAQRGDGSSGSSYTGIEIAPNVFMLDKSMVYDLFGGVKVAAVAGRYDALSYEDASALGKSCAKTNGEVTEDDVREMKECFDEMKKRDVIDIFLCRDWPAGTLEVHGREIGREAKSASSTGSPVARALALALSPRYHFAGSHPFFFEREPYINAKSDPSSSPWVTRFINLAGCANEDSEKWMHALKIEPGSTIDRALLCKIPPDSGPNPYLVQAGAKRRADELQPDWRDDAAKKPKPPPQRPVVGDPDKTVFVRNLNYKADEGAIAEFFGECGELLDVRLATKPENGQSRGFCHVAFKTVEGAQAALERNNASFFGRDIAVEMANERKERQPRAPPQGCWFCLSNEKDLHLVASISGECFMSMDKGGLTAEHCQLIPVEHLPSFVSLPQSTAEEIWKYLQALRMYAETKQQKVVVFERHLELRNKGGNHCQMNCIPVDDDRAALAEKIFKQAAKKLDFAWTKIDPPPSAAEAQAAIKAIADEGEYYAVHLPCGSILIQTINKGEKHWMQLGREVISHLIKAPERANWQTCMQDEDAETARTAAFTEAFAAFDPMKQ